MKEFSINTKVYFGQGSLEKLNEIKNKRVLIVCDKFMETSGMAEKVKQKLVDCQVAVFSDIVSDPSVEVIAEGIQKLQNCDAQVMIALGGGSSIDGAKAMREYAIHHGVPESDILVENQSKNTYQNMIFSKQVVQGLK